MALSGVPSKYLEALELLSLDDDASSSHRPALCIDVAGAASTSPSSAHSNVRSACTYCENSLVRPKYLSTLCASKGQIPVLENPALIFVGISALWKPAETHIARTCLLALGPLFLSTHASL